MVYLKNTPKRGPSGRCLGYILAPPLKNKNKGNTPTKSNGHFFLFFILNIALFTTLVDNLIGDYIEVLSWKELAWAPGPVQSETKICNLIP